MKPCLRKKIRNGKPIYYLVSNARDERGKVRQKVIAYLGQHQTPDTRKRWLMAQHRKLALQVNDARREHGNTLEWFTERNKGKSPRKPKRGESRTLNSSVWLAKGKLTRLESAHQRARESLDRINAALRKL